MPGWLPPTRVRNHCPLASDAVVLSMVSPGPGEPLRAWSETARARPPVWRLVKMYVLLVSIKPLSAIVAAHSFVGGRQPGLRGTTCRPGEGYKAGGAMLPSILIELLS